MSDIAKGACFCGAVRIETTGPAAAQGFCHCNDCRRWSAAPVTAYSLWPAGAVKATAGAAHLKSWSATGQANRRHCARCGGSVMTEIGGAGLIDVCPAIFEALDFTPTAHVHYGVRVIDMADGLPKYRDMPEQAGGSGALIAE